MIHVCVCVYVCVCVCLSPKCCHFVYENQINKFDRHNPFTLSSSPCRLLKLLMFATFWSRFRTFISLQLLQIISFFQHKNVSFSPLSSFFIGLLIRWQLWSVLMRSFRFLYFLFFSLYILWSWNLNSVVCKICLIAVFDLIKWWWWVVVCVCVGITIYEVVFFAFCYVC